MGDAADDIILQAENEGAFEEDDSKMDPDQPGMASGFFQRMVDEVGKRQLADLFDVSVEYIGDAKDTGYVFSVDPAAPGRGMVVAIDEASEIIRKRGKTGINWDGLKAQFPSYAAWAAKYTGVPQINNPKEYTMDMSGIAKMRRDLEGMLEKFTSMVSIVERFGGEPGDGTVIKFEHSFNDDPEKVYDYVAVRKFGKWYVTGRPFCGQAVSWSRLLEFIGEGRAWICREFEEVPLPGAAADASEDKAAAVANLLANASGRDTAEVAAEVVALLESK